MCCSYVVGGLWLIRTLVAAVAFILHLIAMAVYPATVWGIMRDSGYLPNTITELGGTFVAGW